MLEFLIFEAMEAMEVLKFVAILVIITFFEHLREVRVHKFLNDSRLQGPRLLKLGLLATPFHCT